MSFRWKEYEAPYEYPGHPDLVVMRTEKKLQVFRPSPYVGSLGKWIDVETVSADTPDEE